MRVLQRFDDFTRSNRCRISAIHPVAKCPRTGRPTLFGPRSLRRSPRHSRDVDERSMSTAYFQTGFRTLPRARSHVLRVGHDLGAGVVRAKSIIYIYIDTYLNLGAWRHDERQTKLVHNIYTVTQCRVS